MRSSIRTFWRRLEAAVHPDDEQVVRSQPHTFNLDFPPPAFIGDVDNAPIVVLMANGGYDPRGTPSEFPDQSDYAEYRDWLRGDRIEPPRNLTRYYTRHALFPWVQTGKAVIVNAVAYRSPQISREPQNKRLADRLPSVEVHRRWLREELLPAAQQGRRLVIAHRWSLWDLPKSIQHVQRSRAPISENLSRDLMAQAESWLARRATGDARTLD